MIVSIVEFGPAVPRFDCRRAASLARRQSDAWLQSISMCATQPGASSGPVVAEADDNSPPCRGDRPSCRSGARWTSRCRSASTTRSRHQINQIGRKRHSAARPSCRSVPLHAFSRRPLSRAFRPFTVTILKVFKGSAAAVPD
jgi:hypothetical protein